MDADFDSDQVQGVEPLVVNFQDQSGGCITSWDWNFGDGETSEERNATHVYEAPDVGNVKYTVSLDISNLHDFDSVTRNEYITVTPCGNDPVKMGGTTTGPTSTDIQSFYTNHAYHGASIEIQALRFTGALLLDRNIQVALKGGLNCDYQPLGVTTRVIGSMTISKGSVVVENIELR